MLVASEIKDIFVRSRWTLALAESCTGGLASAQITSVAGASEFYIGSIISYANSVKTDFLGVPSELLKTAGAVSREVAIAMSLGVKKQMKTDWSAAVTGIAGPSGGTQDKPVGTVWFAIRGPNFEWSEKKIFQGNRQQIQEGAVRHILESLRDAAAKASLNH